MTRRRYVAVAALLVPLALVGCDGGGSGDAPDPAVEVAWPATDVPLAEGGLVWWADGELHRGTGRPSRSAVRTGSRATSSWG
ncbi:hypothetical protein [Nocardioides zeae]